MKKIIIIGVGQLGFRHAQSFLGFGESLEILLVERKKDQLTQTLTDLNGDKGIGNVNYIGSSDTPTNEEFDLAIIATNADVRYIVASELIKNNIVKNLILEKNIFQNKDDFNTFNNLITVNKVDTWVNCPMRSFKVYSELKLELDRKFPIEMNVVGNNWGLACNSIHYIDLVAFLTESNCISIRAGKLEVIESKRAGFVEFNGSLSVEYNEMAMLNLTCGIADEFTRSIEIINGETRFLLNENERKLYKYCNEDIVAVCDFELPFQSQMTAIVAHDIFNSPNKVQLPKFMTTKNLHMSYIDFFLNKYNVLSGSNNQNCNIT